MGAWIETAKKLVAAPDTNVAPYVGAWIETVTLNTNHQTGYVAPYVGAWIETNTMLIVTILVMSHLTWVRGLKQS